MPLPPAPGSELRDAFFDGWGGVWHALVLGSLGYVSLLVMLRLSGKRALAKMNIFDLVVTVALGSTLATITLSSEVSLVDGAVAILVLLVLQSLFAWLQTQSRRLDGWINGEPVLVLREGRLLRGAMRRERVTEAKVLAAVRAQGLASLEEVAAVVLETNGTFSVVRRGSERLPSALRDLPGEPA